MEFTLTTGSGLVLTGDIYRPVKEAKKLIILVHGLGEHFLRYKSWASRFTEKGVVVVGADLPGHGRSPGKRGHIISYQLLNSIIESLAKYSAGEYGNLPIGLYGHSLGGNIVLNYLLTNTYGFDFAVISSPWLKLVNPPSLAKLSMARAINRIAPGITQSNGLELEHISRAENVQEKYDSDPYVHNRVSVRLGVEATDAARRVLDTGRNIDIPVLIMHGDDDKITSPTGSRELAGLNPNVSLKIWEKGYHELHNEDFNDKVFDYLNSWLENQ